MSETEFLIAVDELVTVILRWISKLDENRVSMVIQNILVARPTVRENIRQWIEMTDNMGESRTEKVFWETANKNPSGVVLRENNQK